MKKEEVYKIIEYNGVYDDKVKKNLKKLIKKYHPDKNKKDKNSIEVIYEVKKELENNKVSYKPTKKTSKTTVSKFMDDTECLKNIMRLEKIERGNNQELNMMYDDLADLFKKYREIYHKICASKDNLCTFEDEMKNLNKIDFIMKTGYLVFLGLLITCVLSYNVYLLFLIIGSLIIISLGTYAYSKKLREIRGNINHVSKNLENKAGSILLVQDEIKKLSDKIHSLERKNNNVKNDIRFYKNMQNK